VPLSDGSFHLDDYVNYVQEFIRHMQGTYGNCHVISVCQPTVPVLAAVSLMASRGETTPLTMTMMGGPIDARKSPTAVNNLATKKSYSWFENNVIYRVPGNFPGAGRRVYPGFMQHTGFVAMNPDRHATSHYDFFKDLLKGDDASARGPPQVLRRVQRRAGHGRRLLPGNHQNGVSRVQAGQRHLGSCNPEGKLNGAAPRHHHHGAADSGRRAGRHFRLRPDRAAHDLCTGIPKSMQATHGSGGCRDTTAFSAAAAGAIWCTRRKGLYLGQPATCLSVHYGQGAATSKAATVPKMWSPLPRLRSAS
jgi:poly(3-hydroxybutyrate) depolymerase